MSTFERFEQLDDENFFVDFVRNHFIAGWPGPAHNSGVSVDVDHDRLVLAHQTYLLSLSRYAIVIKSQNPDQYKRAAALLHAIYKTLPVTGIAWDENSEYYRDFYNVGVSHSDAEHYENYCKWFEEYANLAMGFDLAFRCCQVYETDMRMYNGDFLDNMCYYLADNNELSLESFTMIFKAFMN